MSDVGRILITADDANVTPNIDKAVLDLVELGVVTNVALIVNTDSGFDYERCLANNTTISIHLNLTHGFPASNMSQSMTLVKESGDFHSPKDLLKPPCGDLAGAIASYKSSVLPYIHSDEILCELQAQVELFVGRYGKLPIYNSFHQDLDSDDRIFEIVDRNIGIPRTRQHLLKSCDLAGFHYRLFDKCARLQTYIREVEKMIYSAINISVRCGGIPFEVALHPSTSSTGLEMFTAYQMQRVYEYEAWRSDRIVSFIHSGNREGSIISFPVGVEGRV